MKRRGENANHSMITCFHMTATILLLVLLYNKIIDKFGKNFLGLENMTLHENFTWNRLVHNSMSAHKAIKSDYNNKRPSGRPHIVPNAVQAHGACAIGVIMPK